MLGKNKKRLECLECRLSPLKDHDPEVHAFIEAFIKQDPEGADLVRAKFRAKMGRVIGYSNGLPIREAPDHKEIERLGKMLNDRILIFGKDYFSRRHQGEGV